MTESQIKAILISKSTGLKLAKTHPEIANEYRAGKTYQELAEKYLPDIFTKRTGPNSIYEAVKLLIPDKERYKIGKEHVSKKHHRLNKGQKRKRAITNTSLDGLFQLFENRGITTWSNFELDFAAQLFKSNSFYKDSKNIASVLNYIIHEEEIRNYGGVTKKLTRYFEKDTKFVKRKQWTPKEIEIAKALTKVPNFSYETIAQTLNLTEHKNLQVRTPFAVKQKLKKERERLQKSKKQYATLTY